MNGGEGWSTIQPITADKEGKAVEKALVTRGIIFKKLFYSIFCNNLSG